MERCSTPTRRVSPSEPASSQKRTSSPGAFTPSVKKPKAELTRANSDKDKKRRRRKKKQPITRDVDMSPGLAQKDCSSPHNSFATASSSTLMDCIGSSNPLSLPPISGLDRSPHVASPPPLYRDTDRPEHRDTLQQESAMQVVHFESKSLHDHKALFASLLSSLVCQICLDLLHKPFALTPCGHVSCYSCLINWFNADRQPDELEGDNVFRKKTCPQCRAVVRGRPVEAWNVKDMVATVVKSGLALDFPPPAEVDSDAVAPRELADSVPPLRDPWADVFPHPPLRTGLSPTGGSLDAFGMFDAEDQVYRCLDCMHEIWGRSCSHCGRQYDDHNVDPSDEEAPPENHGIWNILPVMERIMGWPRVASANRSEDGSYEASFIDDEGSEGGAIEIMSDNSHSVTEITPMASEQDGDDSGNVQIPSPNKDEEVGETDGLPTVKRHSDTRRTRLQVLSEDDKDDSDTDEKSSHHEQSGEDEDDGSFSRPPMRLFGRNKLSFSSEAESSDSQCSGSDDDDSVGCDDGHVSRVQRIGFDAEDEEDDEEGEW